MATTRSHAVRPKNSVCCRCNSKGRCINCSCKKSGKLCENCLPYRGGHCSNRDTAVGTGTLTARVEPGLDVPTSTNDLLDIHGTLQPRDIDSVPSDNVVGSMPVCFCGRQMESQSMVRCAGPGRELFHRDCVGIDGSEDTSIGSEWWCLQCSLQRVRHVRTLRHIPKGARVQAASILANIVEACVGERSSFVPWHKLFLFASTALAVPNPPASQKKVSLTTSVKNQLQSFVVQPINMESIHAVTESAPVINVNLKLKKCIETKIADGDITGAVRILSSNTTLAPFNEEVAEALQSKHPPTPCDLQLPAAPDDSTEPLRVTSENVKRSIRSFKPGSAAGPDKLSPQHLKELISQQTGEPGIRLLTALTSLANLMLAGSIPSFIQPLLYGANLIALQKPDGGVRPIAVGNSIRRMVAKAASVLVGERIGSKLRPVQLGYGSSGGCEAAVHAIRRFLSNSGPRVLMKIDYKNAFNSLRRDRLLEVIKSELPDLYPFIWQVYSSSSTLFFGDILIQSASGVQQGDPLGPALFSLSIHSLASSLLSKVNIWYLDDGTIGGSTEEVVRDFNTILQSSSSLGLELNVSKCEVIFGGMDEDCSMSALEKIHTVAPNIRVIQPHEATLLGAPLTLEALDPILGLKIDEVRRLSSRLDALHTHDALFLLRNCLAIPKLLYILRTAPMWKVQEGLNTFDETVRQALQSVCNINMDNSTWTQASLPTSKGGLGVRRASDLALPAFLASCYGTHDLVSSLLPPVELGNDPLQREALDLWEANTTCPLPPEELRGRQRRWDELFTQKTHEDLLEGATDSITRARLLSTATKESGAWLNVLPIPHLGTKLDNDSIRIATGLRLGADIVMEHTCVCGASVDRKGTHGLSCRKSGGRISRHRAANETLRRALVSGGVPSILEPVGVCREDAKRPDGMTLIPWESGRALLWDFTCWDTLAPSNRLTASTGPGVLACSAERFKQRKYSSLTPTFIFAPVCIESLGAWGESAKKFVHQVGARVRENTGEVRATSFLIQRLAIDVQRGNVASVMATIPATKDWGEVGRLLTI